MKTSLITERLLLTLWVGSLCAIGYIAVPVAFATLDNVTLAGHYAGKLFSIVNMLGLGCGTVLLISKLISFGVSTLSQWRSLVLILMIISTAILSFYLQPEIAVIKQLMATGNKTVLERFDFFHILSENLYLFTTLLGLALVVSSDKVENKNG